MSRNLNVASALLSVIAIIGVFSGLQHLLLLAPLPEELPTVSQIRDFSPEVVDAMELSTQFEGLYLLALALTTFVIALIPYRKGEKWAWYTELVIGGIYQAAFLILLYIAPFTLASTYLQMGIVMLIIWIVGLALPAKEILGS